MSKAERTRQFIIEKAAPIINRKGMAGSSLSDIMAATGLAKGCIYGHFANKDEICLEVFNYMTQSYANELQARMDLVEGNKAKLFAYLDFVLQDQSQDNFGGCPIVNFGAEADDTHPQVRERVQQVIAKSKEQIRELLQNGIEAGEFSADLQADVQALKIFALVEGVLILSRIENKREQLRLIVDLLKAEIDSF